MYNGLSRGRIIRLNYDGALDNSFNPGSGFDASVLAVALQADGKVMVGGWFNLFNGSSRSRIARLNADGTLDTSFDPGTGFNSYVSSLAMQPDGKVIVGGGFTTYNGAAVNTIVRLNTDGSLDNSFNGGNFTGNVMAVALQSDGKIVVAGVFDTFNGISRNGIVRLNADGSLDSSFDPGTGFNGNVNTILVQDDGKVMAGGSFSSINGTARSSIARLNANGSLDNSFNPGTGFNAPTGPMSLPVQSIALQADGKVVVGGAFTSYNGISRNGVVRLHTEGSLDETFNTGTSFNSAVSSVALQEDGKLVVGGAFIGFSSMLRQGVVRLLANGIPDITFNPFSGFDSVVQAIDLQNDGKLVVGGNFSHFNGIARNRIARLNPNGSLDELFNPGSGFNGLVLDVALQRDGKLLVAGSFTDFNGMPRFGIVRLNSNGSLDSSFETGTGFNNQVTNITMQPDGRIVVVGNFTVLNGTPRNRIVRLHADGSLDESFNPGTGFDNSVQSLVLQEDGKLVVGGFFSNFNGVIRNKIARLNSDGTLDFSFNPEAGLDFRSYVGSIILQPNDKIIIGGNFSAYNGTARNNIARLNVDGSLDTSFNPGTGFNGTVYSLVLQNDGKLVVGGLFTAFNSTVRNFISRLNSDGSLDNSFNSGNGFNGLVSSIALQSDGNMVVGGQFTAINAVPRTRIARLNNNDFPLSTAKDLHPGLNLLLYPNPSQGDINLEFSEAEALVGGAKLTLHDAMGRQVLSREVTATEEKAGIKLTTTGLTSGIYFLNISTRGRSISKRVVLTE